MNKKANSATNVPKWLFNVIVTLFVIVYIFMIVMSFLNQSIDTEDAETKIMFNSLIYSKSCLALEENEIAQPGIIDMEKVSNKRISNCLMQEDTEYGIKINDLKGNLLKEAKVFSLAFELQIPVCETTSEFTCDELTGDILYKDANDKLQFGVMTLEVVRRA
jgi:hypothetical protein